MVSLTGWTTKMITLHDKNFKNTGNIYKNFFEKYIIISKHTTSSLRFLLSLETIKNHFL